MRKGKGKGKSSSVVPQQARHPSVIDRQTEEIVRRATENARKHRDREINSKLFGRKKAGMTNQVEEEKFTKEEKVAKGIPTEMFAELPQQQVPDWYKDAKQTAAADNESSSFAELQMFLVIVMFGTICLGYLSMKGPDLIDEVEIPGLGTVNLKNAAQNLFPGAKKMSKFDDIALMSLDEGDNGDNCNYGSYQPVGSCGGVGEGDSMLSHKTFSPGISLELESGL